jgi:hypothetical protein
MKKYLTAIILICFCPGCEGLLDIGPTDSYSEEIVWSDLELVEVFVNSKYHALTSGFFANKTWAMMSSYSDEAYCTWDWGGIYVSNRGEITADNLGGLDMWAEKYKYIRDANLFFSRIDDVSGNERLKERLKGEMKFIRAAAYAELLQRYGGVPIITKVFELNDDYLLQRDSYENCVRFLVNELDTAALLLKNNPPPPEEFGRATEGAVLALKSRLLLYAASSFNNPSNDERKWQAAASAAKAVLESGAYKLSDNGDYNSIFLDPKNPELILTRPYNKTFVEGYDHLEVDLTNSPNGYGGWSGNTPTQNLVDDFEMSNGKMIDEPDSGYDPSDPYRNRDPRFHYSIVYDGSMYRDRPAEFFVPGGKDTPEGEVHPWDASKTGYTMRKFMNESADFMTASGKQHWIFFRLTEAYLNYAEALFHLGDEDEARNYMNIIRARPGVNMPPVSHLVTGADLLEKIRHERRIELVFEGHRYYDVRRWKIASQTENEPAMGIDIKLHPDHTKTYSRKEVQKRVFLEKHYLLPIPQSEINKNYQLNQNPGY